MRANLIASIKNFSAECKLYHHCPGTEVGFANCSGNVERVSAQSKDLLLIRSGPVSGQLRSLLRLNRCLEVLQA
jgi:hypothetical protein